MRSIRIGYYNAELYNSILAYIYIYSSINVRGNPLHGCVTRRSKIEDEVSGAVFVRDFARDLVLFERPTMARKANRTLYTAQPMAQT